MSKVKSKTNQDDVIVSALKKRYFELAAIERIGETPQLTDEINKLEEAIKELQKKN